jgi:hypothetical protein
MATYTLHVPADADPGDPDALENAELVKDGFSWGAFVFTFLWFFWHRRWLVGLAVLVAVVGLAFVVQATPIGSGGGFVALLLLSVLIGLEASSLRRWGLRRRKPLVDVVTASGRDEAEVKSFARWLEQSGSPRVPVRPAGAPIAPYRGPEPVIGLFPETERPR